MGMNEGTQAHPRFVIFDLAKERKHNDNCNDAYGELDTRAPIDAQKWRVNVHPGQDYVEDLLRKDAILGKSGLCCRDLQKLEAIDFPNVFDISRVLGMAIWNVEAIGIEGRPALTRNRITQK